MNSQTDPAFLNYEGIGLMIFEKNGFLTFSHKKACHGCENISLLKYEIIDNVIEIIPVDDSIPIHGNYSVVVFDNNRMVLVRDKF